jgi:hypothetical protein
MIIPTVAHQIIQSRLLLLETKREMLYAAERRLHEDATDALRQRVERLRLETSYASHMYRTSVLEWGPVETSEYWLVAYARLIEMGHALTYKLRSAADELPVHERHHVSADVEQSHVRLANRAGHLWLRLLGVLLADLEELTLEADQLLVGRRPPLRVVDRRR